MISRRKCAALALAAVSLTFAATRKGVSTNLRLNLRSRVEAFRGSGDWREVHFQEDFPVNETAILICDMWDKHWCTGASRRVDALARKMAPVLEIARARGVQIIHSPSDVMDFYKDALQRKRMIDIPAVIPPPGLALTDPPLPIDDSAGGCDTPDNFYKAWTREHSALRIAEEDVISDRGAEVYTFLRQRGIKNLLVMGVHTNMCVLRRSFAIRQMVNWGIRCILVRDLTDAMYNPAERPFVSHDAGTELVVQHIEKYWSPSTLSTDLK